MNDFINKFLHTEKTWIFGGLTTNTEKGIKAWEIKKLGFIRQLYAKVFGLTVSFEGKTYLVSRKALSKFQERNIHVVPVSKKFLNKQYLESLVELVKNKNNDNTVFPPTSELDLGDDKNNMSNPFFPPTSELDLGDDKNNMSNPFDESLYDDDVVAQTRMPTPKNDDTSTQNDITSKDSKKINDSFLEQSVDDINFFSDEDTTEDSSIKNDKDNIE